MAHLYLKKFAAVVEVDDLARWPEYNINAKDPPTKTTSSSQKTLTKPSAHHAKGAGGHKAHNPLEDVAKRYVHAIPRTTPE